MTHCNTYSTTITFIVCKYLWIYITDEVIVIFDNNQDILTHLRYLTTICILIYISPSFAEEIASVKTKYY